MTTIINASPTNGLVQTADGSGVLKVQSNGVTTNALAWVNFNGTVATPTIRAQYNVSSITKSSTGYYIVNFTTALADANYSAMCSGRNQASTTLPLVSSPIAFATTSVTVRYLTVTNSDQDSDYAAIAIHGN